MLKNSSDYVRRSGVVLLFLLLLVCLPAGAQQGGGQGSHGDKQPVEAASMCSIAVYSSGNQIATVAAELLKTLEAVELTLPGVKKMQSGPRLAELLKSLKIEEFKQVRVSGYAKGRLATAEYLIKKEDLHDRIILSYSRRGTAKLVVPELAFDDWVVDVYRLDIE